MSYQITPEQAPQILEWLATRGGVAVWQNCNLSSHAIGSLAFTPATHDDGRPATAPSWQYGQTPVAVVTDPAAFVVQTWRETERVKVMASKYGPPCDPIARGRTKLDAALDRAGQGATWRWDRGYYVYGSGWRQVIVEAPANEIPLTQWAESNRPVATPTA